LCSLLRSPLRGNRCAPGASLSQNCYFQRFSFIDFPTLRLLAASASRRREAGLLTRSSILSSLDAKRTNPQTPNLSTLARICLMAFQRFSFQHSWRARKKKINIKNGWRGHCRIIYTASAFLQPPSAEAPVSPIPNAEHIAEHRMWRGRLFEVVRLRCSAGCNGYFEMKHPAELHHQA